MKSRFKKLFKKVKIKEKPVELIPKNKQVTFRTTDYIYTFLEKRSKYEKRSKSDILNEILDFEAYRYNEREKDNRYAIK